MRRVFAPLRTRSALRSQPHSEELAVIESFLMTGIQFQQHHAARIRTWAKELPAH